MTTRTTKGKAGATSKKASSTNEEQQTSDLNWQTISVVCTIGLLTILAVGTLVLLGRTTPEAPDDWNPNPTPVTTIGEPPSSGGVPSAASSTDFIDACSGDFKTKIQYMYKHNRGLYNDIRDDWRRNQGMGQMDPFEAADDLAGKWDRCYSDSFDGSWMC